MRLIARRVVLILAVSGVLAATSTSAAPQKFTAPEYVMGNPRAPVTVVEYASLSCPHCARFDINIFPELKRKYIDTGRVRYVFREFLTPPEDVAAAGFLLARCAGPARYFTVVDEIFHRQAEMFQTDQVYPILMQIGQANGLSPDQFKACLTDKADNDALNKRVQKAVNVDHVEYTPTVRVNGHEIRTPATREIELADVDQSVQAALKSAPPARVSRAPHAQRRTQP
jgi:protein-disulfide isomerase